MVEESGGEPVGEEEPFGHDFMGLTQPLSEKKSHLGACPSPSLFLELLENVLSSVFSLGILRKPPLEREELL